MSKDLKMEADLEYEISELSWNRYELQDGTILRVLDIPNKVFRAVGNNQDGTKRYFVFGGTNVSAVVPSALKGAPNPKPFDPKSANLKPVPFEAISEPWNVFLLSDNTTLRTRTIVSRIMKSEQRNMWGEPVYTIKSSQSVDAIEAE